MIEGLLILLCRFYPVIGGAHSSTIRAYKVRGEGNTSPPTLGQGVLEGHLFQAPRALPTEFVINKTLAVSVCMAYVEC